MKRWSFALLACSLAACSDASPAAESSSAAAAAELYTSSGCALCHGKQLEGGLAGPKLERLAEHWNAKDLASFLGDPAPFVSERARLAQQAAKYPQPMQPQPNLSIADRQALADWLLEQ